MKWFKRGAWGVLGLLLLALAALAVYAWRTLPQTEGRWVLPGAQAEMRIERDADGVPTLRANSERDAAYALGVVHAQDRLWQLETHRRIASGRLAEAFGPSALETDRFLRALGVRRAAAEQWQRLPAASQGLLQAYADGVNAVLQRGVRALPPEFLILGLTPEPWQPVDSLAWATMMAWDLGGNWNSELLRLRLALQLPVERIHQLMPPYPGEQPLPTMDFSAFYRSLKLDGAASVTAWQRLPEMAPESGIEGVGSNNWVVAGSHSRTGQPLLANDPHLKLSTPTLWYLARVQVPGLQLAGATLPGTPGVLLGQNGHIAWGFTNTAPDVQDLYIEALDPQDPTRYRVPVTPATPDGWARFETTTETIKVKGQPDVVMTVRRSRHGPVISDAGTTPDVLGPAAKPTHVLALRWTALDTDNDPITASLALQRATSVQAFFEATRGWVAPMQNMVVADTAGRIGLISPGRVPVRKPENDLHGLAPAPGWDEKYDWAGWVPVDETPRETDPARGWLATANQRITPPGYPYFFTSEWGLPYRQQRIEQVLGSRPKHSLDDLAALQADELSLAVPALLPWLQKARSVHPLAPAAQAQLAGFDGRMAADRAAPLIFWAWQRQLARALFADDVSEALWEKSLSGRNFQEALERVLRADDAAWCDHRATPLAETCADQAGLALTRALEELQQRFGADVARWRWGDAHQARGEHRPFSRVPVLVRLFELRTPLGGDTHTVNVSRVNLRPDRLTGDLFHSDHGPSLRALYDLADPAKSRVMTSTGQSGNPFSAHFRNFVRPWAEVKYRPLWPEPGAPSRVLVVQPAQSTP
ncbi:hypothetical protein D621_12675 [beta proteobacterium AAP51]|nr:hypothetical protein D621_12675 [beta proteobacterium AAP51]